MGREIRKVPANWEHPVDNRGIYKPLLGNDFTEVLNEWEDTKKQWNNGLRDDFEGGWKPRSGKEINMSFEQWHGEKPLIEDYMPQWSENEKTHIQMYEDTSEGTPISPIFDNAEEMARWLTDNKASSFGDMTATYEQWLSTINIGFAPSMVVSDGKIKSGVEENTNS